MQKKFVYIGIGLLVLAILVIFIAPSIALQFKTSTYNVTLARNQTLTVPLNMTKESFLLMVYRANSTISFFMFNASSYASINFSGNIYGQAVGYEGRGTVAIIPNALVGSFPTDITNSSSGSYFNPNDTILPPGDYYLVFKGNAQSSTPLTYQLDINDNVSSNLISVSILGIVFLAALIGGIAAIVYGVIKKGAETAAEIKTDEQANKAYAQIEKKDAPKKTTASKSSKAKKKAKSS